MHGVDEAIFRWINGWPEGLKQIFYFFSEGNKMGGVRLLLVAIVLGMLLRGGKARIAILCALVAWPIANLITDVLKSGLQMQRPCVELSDVILRVDKLTSFGTASAHSANMMAVAVAMAFFVGRWSLIWFGVALFTGLSRIYVGVHYPSQVLFGWFVGAFAAILVVRMVEGFAHLRNNRTQNTEAENDGVSEQIEA